MRANAAETFFELGESETEIVSENKEKSSETVSKIEES
jgi:hypothetical protein